MKPTRVTIPNELKSDLPQTKFGKILGATPVVMAVVATMLAGLASSEMTRAQYDRSLGAQQQSKAGDQWSFFQAKRVRAAIQRNSADLLQAMSGVQPLDPAALVRDIEQWQGNQFAELKPTALEIARSSAGEQALALLCKGELPAKTEIAAIAPALKSAIDGIENSVSDPEMRPLLLAVDNVAIEEGLKTARAQVQAFDAATKPINQAIDQLEKLLTRHNSLLSSGNAGEHLNSISSLAYRAFTGARLNYAALRYEHEARLNQVIANLYELQVRKSNISAEHHHKRSQRFFFGMLAAQAGVIISTFAMAARKRNLLWSLAAGAGLIAIAFAVYVYFYV